MSCFSWSGVYTTANGNAAAQGLARGEGAGWTLQTLLWVDGRAWVTRDLRCCVSKNPSSSGRITAPAWVLPSLPSPPIWAWALASAFLTSLISEKCLPASAPFLCPGCHMHCGHRCLPCGPPAATAPFPKAIQAIPSQVCTRFP